MISQQSLFSEEILYLNKNPNHKKIIQNANVKYNDENPSCGDSITIFAKVDKTKNILEEISWDGKGCAISQASAELLCEEVSGKKIKEVMKIDSKKITEILGLELGVVRIKCAMLPIAVLKKGIIKTFYNTNGGGKYEK
ncbi:iron-sulfur cluster assembly scaffold protein [Candidatus Woesearchaeota archaeon]|nr:iron-sulfur cluster assembly scaffold protein [Candidatus Woesearchaeota archaeon]